MRDGGAELLPLRHVGLWRHGVEHLGGVCLFNINTNKNFFFFEGGGGVFCYGVKRLGREELTKQNKWQKILLINNFIIIFQFFFFFKYSRNTMYKKQ